MSKRDVLVLLNDILNSGKKIIKYVENYSYNDFILDSKTVDAVVRNLEIIGEASKKLSENFKEKYNNIPWRTIGDLRNRIIHEYFGIDEAIIWKIVKEELEPLLKQIEIILKKEQNI
jgi:uncharacterized protein with HEPN domain